jgi:methylated-DNA-[protein]-cysteine S-methyltransferase
MGKVINSLKPEIEENSRVLILGTMPGPESLRRKQYYANPRNQFWKIIYRVLGESREPPSDYNERIKFLVNKRVALWDVLESCEREGANDSKIKSGKPNDFEARLGNSPGMKCLFFNGKTAEYFFKKCGCPKFPTVRRVRLPSSSSANTRMTLDEKMRCWQAIRDFL